MYAALAAHSGNPAVAALLGVGAAGLAGVVVAMAWTVHARQIRLAEKLARRQFVSLTGPGAPGHDGAPDSGETAGRANGTAPAVPGNGMPGTPGGAGYAAAAHTGAAQQGASAAAGASGTGQAAPVVIEGPETVVAGEQAHYRVRPSGGRQVVAWAAGGGSVSQSPDPANPHELLMISDRPGKLTIIVRVRDGMTERRGTKAITAVPEVTAPPPFTLRLFLNGWGLVVVAVLITGSAASLDALGNLSSSDFIAVVSPLAAVLAVVAVARGRGDQPAPHRAARGADRLSAHAARAAEPILPGAAPQAEATVHNQSAL